MSGMWRTKVKGMMHGWRLASKSTTRRERCGVVRRKDGFELPKYFVRFLYFNGRMIRRSETAQKSGDSGFESRAGLRKVLLAQW